MTGRANAKASCWLDEAGKKRAIDYNDGDQHKPFTTAAQTPRNPTSRSISKALHRPGVNKQVASHVQCVGRGCEKGVAKNNMMIGADKWD